MVQPASEFSFVIRDVGLGMALLESFANGFYTSLFVFSLWLLLPLKTHSRRYTGCKYMLAIIVLLYVLSVVHLACRWNMVRRAFAFNPGAPNTTLQSFLHQPTWSIVLSGLSFSLMTLIADSVLIWRCWIVWNRDWRAPILPLLLTIVGTVFCAISLAYQIMPQSRLFTSNRARFTEPGIVYFSLSLASTVASTLLIVYRIISISRRALMLSRYKGIVEIVSESAALYAVTLIVFLPFFARKDFSQGYAQAILVPITGIAPTIITARVSLGLAHEQSLPTATAPTFVSQDNWTSRLSSPVRIRVSHCDSDSALGEAKGPNEKSFV